MSIEAQLKERSGNRCELCGSTDDIDIFEVDSADGSAEKSIMICGKCATLMDDPSKDTDHWRCLNESMWSTVPAVQVTAYRILKSIAGEGWPQDMLDMFYMEPEVQEWVDTLCAESEEREPTLDSNGTVLEEGDNVTIIRDLDVKGAGFTAKPSHIDSLML
jgi:protein PhnA